MPTKMIFPITLKEEVEITFINILKPCTRFQKTYMPQVL
ncbi:hypothetical protein BSV1_G13 (plasmid) [Borreliella finlandensis]|uniref:Uncharacterized protein n=1 Tax=Borreliella finlandensis TaxID=498741 RepID=A0A806C3I6_9SPIR|nr:hypothetical protein BSV1_G13 [Borreliella finlandensis]